jgi:hypothetical protein
MRAVSRRRQCWRWLPLALFGACLNPQPDDNPLNHDNLESVTGGSGDSNSATAPPIFSGDNGDDGQSGEPTPSSSAVQPQLPAGAGGVSAGADAGAPPPSDGGVPEGDAGVAND